MIVSPLKFDDSFIKKFYLAYCTAIRYMDFYNYKFKYWRIDSLIAFVRIYSITSLGKLVYSQFISVNFLISFSSNIFMVNSMSGALPFLILLTELSEISNLLAIAFVLSFSDSAFFTPSLIWGLMNTLVPIIYKDLRSDYSLASYHLPWFFSQILLNLLAIALLNKKKRRYIWFNYFQPSYQLCLHGRVDKPFVFVSNWTWCCHFLKLLYLSEHVTLLPHPTNDLIYIISTNLFIVIFTLWAMGNNSFSGIAIIMSAFPSSIGTVSDVFI